MADCRATKKKTAQRLRESCACLSWNLPRKLVLAEAQDVASDLGHDLALILGSAVLQDVLDDIVAVLVLSETNQRGVRRVMARNVRTPAGAADVASNTGTDANLG